MGTLLTQEEVDALLKGLSDGEIETEGSVEGDGQEVLPYDFLSPDWIVRGPMPTAEIVNEKFACQSAASLLSFMGRVVDVSVESFEIVKYGEFLRRLPERASFHVYKMAPLRGACFFFFDDRLISHVVDILFGGSGKLPVERQRRDFTSTECRVRQRLLNICFEDLGKAWSLLGEVSFQSLRSETRPQFVNIVSPRDIVLASVFHVGLESDRTVMGYCIPYSALEPMKGQLCG